MNLYLINNTCILLKHLLFFIFIKILNYLGGVWFDCFLFSFSLKIENGNENAFGWIFENIFSENENKKQSENENNKISFSFSWK